MCPDDTVSDYLEMPVTRVLVWHLAPFAATAAETSVMIGAAELAVKARVAAGITVVPTGAKPASTAKGEQATELNNDSRVMVLSSLSACR